MSLKKWIDTDKKSAQIICFCVNLRPPFIPRGATRRMRDCSGFSRH